MSRFGNVWQYWGDLARFGEIQGRDFLALPGINIAGCGSSVSVRHVCGLVSPGLFYFVWSRMVWSVSGWSVMVNIGILGQT